MFVCFALISNEFYLTFLILIIVLGFTTWNDYRNLFISFGLLFDFMCQWILMEYVDFLLLVSSHEQNQTLFLIGCICRPGFSFFCPSIVWFHDRLLSLNINLAFWLSSFSLRNHINFSLLAFLCRIFHKSKVFFIQKNFH